MMLIEDSIRYFTLIVNYI